MSGIRKTKMRMKISDLKEFLSGGEVFINKYIQNNKKQFWEILHASNGKEWYM